MSRLRRVRPQPIPPPPSQTGRLEILLYDRPTYVPASSSAAAYTPAISLVPPSDPAGDHGAFIVDKVLTPFDWGEQAATADDYDTDVEDERYRRDPRRRTVQRVLNYVVGWPDEPYALQLVPCTRILDYVSPRTLEDWEYARTERQRELKEAAEAAAAATAAAKLASRTVHGNAHDRARAVTEDDVEADASERAAELAPGVGPNPTLSSPHSSKDASLWPLPAARKGPDRRKAKGRRPANTAAATAAHVATTTARRNTTSTSHIHDHGDNQSSPADRRRADVTPPKSDKSEKSDSGMPSAVRALTTPRPGTVQTSLSRPSSLQKLQIQLDPSWAGSPPSRRSHLQASSSLTKRSFQTFVDGQNNVSAGESLQWPGARALGAICVGSDEDDHARNAWPTPVVHIESSSDTEHDENDDDDDDSIISDDELGGPVAPQTRQLLTHISPPAVTLMANTQRRPSRPVPPPPLSPLRRQRMTPIVPPSHPADHPQPKVTHVPPPVIPASAAGRNHASRMGVKAPLQSLVTAASLSNDNSISSAASIGSLDSGQDRNGRHPQETPVPVPVPVLPTHATSIAAQQEATSKQPRTSRLPHPTKVVEADRNVDVSIDMDVANADAGETEGLYEVDRLEADCLVLVDDDANANVDGDDTYPAATGAALSGSVPGPPSADKHGRVVRFFLVRWKGDWPAEQNPTWEPAENLPPRMVRQYLKKAARQQQQQ